VSGYKEHTLAGSIVFVVFLLILLPFFKFELSWEQILLCYFLCLVYALWPDVDTNGVAQKLFYGVFLITDIVLILMEYYEYAAVFGLVAMLPIVGKHRGWTHSIFAMLTVPGIVLAAPMLIEKEVTWAGFPYYVASVAGYLSHLIMDRKFSFFG